MNRIEAGKAYYYLTLRLFRYPFHHFFQATHFPPPPSQPFSNCMHAFPHTCFNIATTLPSLVFLFSVFFLFLFYYLRPHHPPYRWSFILVHFITNPVNRPML